MNEYPDNELVNLVCEKNEAASDMLYEKYNYIVDIVCNKYRKSAKILNIDFSELRQEALVAFSKALVSFNQDKETNLATFISLCVERKLSNYIRNQDTNKGKIIRQTFSLDDELYKDGLTLKEKIGNSVNDPQITLEDNETTSKLKMEINRILSPGEKDIYELLINGFSYDRIAQIKNVDVKTVYNAVSRIRKKIRSIVD